MTSALGIIVSKLLAFLMSIITCFLNPFAVTTTALPETPADFTPVVRFVAASDVHINETLPQTEKDRLAEYIGTSYTLAENSDNSYKALDAICFAGDITNTGSRTEAQYFADIVSAGARQGTAVLNVMGNHDVRDDADADTAMFEEILGSELNYHVVINGYHFIGVSYGANGSYISKVGWLEEQISSAVKDDPQKAVFVFQHPHPFGTVYGSVNWGEPVTAAVYAKYSQVVVFSGHSHYPINDPRSLWQGSYTSVGTGTLSYFEMELNGLAGQFPDGYKDAAQFRVVEADANGNVRIRNYDLITDSYFGEEYYLTGFDSKTNFVYTSRNRELTSKSPVFDNGTTAAAEVNAAGETIISFAAAKDNLIVHDYKIVIKNVYGIPVYSNSIMSHYYLNNYGNTETLNLGITELKPGKYTVCVTAQNAYGKLSGTIEGELSF